MAAWHKDRAETVKKILMLADCNHGSSPKQLAVPVLVRCMSSLHPEKQTKHARDMAV